MPSTKAFIRVLNCHSMSQGYAIELYFDPALEDQVLKAWNVLARRHISTLRWESSK
uniref:Uncharacterized protein n=1 Tax=Manihot esculenta TaxID=3983 RepID=A0A199UBR4_MANES